MALHRDVFRFFQGMIAFHKAHSSIGREHFWREDVAWYGMSHAVDMSPDSHSLAYCLHGASLGDADLYVMINAWTGPLRFGIHEGMPGQWQRVIDTARGSPNDIADPGGGLTVESNFYSVQPRSVVVLTRSRSSLDQRVRTS